MNALQWRCCKLSVVVTLNMNSKSCFKQFRMHTFHFRNVFSTEAHSQSSSSESASSKLNMYETFDEVKRLITTLKKHGCTEVVVAKMVRQRPSLIKIADGELETKIRLLGDFGFVDQKLDRLLTMNPQLLAANFENNILPKMEFLKDVFQSQRMLVKALLKAPRLLTCSLEKTLKPSVAFWKGWRFVEAELLNFLMRHPTVLTCRSLTPAKEDLIHKIGIDKQSISFKYIVDIVVSCRPKTVEAKIENLKRWGLSAEEISIVLEAVPFALSYSKENVSEKLDFICNDMSLPINVVKHARLLNMNLQKTLRPRFLVWQKIKSISDLDLPLLKVLQMSEARFVRKIIEGHSESETLRRCYENAISNASNRTKSSAGKCGWNP